MCNFLRNDVSDLVHKATSCVRAKDFGAATAYLTKAMEDTEVKKGWLGLYIQSDKGWEYLNKIVGLAMWVFSSPYPNEIKAKTTALKVLLEEIKKTHETISSDSDRLKSRANIAMMKELFKIRVYSESILRRTFVGLPLIGRLFVVKI